MGFLDQLFQQTPQAPWLDPSQQQSSQNYGLLNAGVALLNAGHSSGGAGTFAPSVGQGIGQAIQAGQQSQQLYAQQMAQNAQYARQVQMQQMAPELLNSPEFASYSPAQKFAAYGALTSSDPTKFVGLQKEIRESQEPIKVGNTLVDRKTLKPVYTDSGIGFDGQATGVIGDVGKTGDEYLATLPASIAAQVKAVAEGRAPYPNSTSQRNPLAQAIRAGVAQYDPNFNTQDFNARAKTRQDFTSGKSRQNIVAIETALNHLAGLQDENTKLGGWATGNTLRNAFLGAANDTDLAAYNVNAKTAADELAKATAGPGGSTTGDREERFKEFGPDQSVEARAAAIRKGVELLNGRLGPLADAYNTGMGVTQEGLALLSPEAQKAYKKLMGENSANIQVPYRTPGREAPAAIPGNAPSPSPVDKVSAIRAELARRGIK